MKLTKEILEPLVNLGMTPKEITKELGTSYQNVLRKMKEFGFKLQGSGGQNRKIHKNPFEDLENEKVLYFLGLIAADGWIGKKNSIWLGLKDLEIIKKYAEFLGEVTIHLPDSSHTTYRVGFGNKETAEFLKFLGITKNKSLTLKINEVILCPHFIRGYFDGDGYAPKIGQSAKITSGSISILTQIQIYLAEFGIQTSVKLQCKNVNNTYALYITGKWIPSFTKFLYQDATIYLQRKKDRFLAQVKSGELLENLK